MVLLGAAALVGVRAADTPALAKVEVVFSSPEKFTDAAQGQRGSEWGLEQNLDTLKDYLIRRASPLVPAGAKLTVTFTDIDLAGEFEPWRSPGRGDNVRIVKDIYTPKMDLSFKLTDGSGKVIKEGTRHLTDMNFMNNLLPASERSESLAYDKQLLADWVNQEFSGLGKDKK